MIQQAHISVYLQAQGAHYLGAHAFKPSEISVQLVYTGGTLPLPYSITPCYTSDGNPSSNFTPGASSFMPIITVPVPPAFPETQVHFLATDFTTACARGNFNLPQFPEMAHLAISVPSSSGSPLLFNHPVLLNAEQPTYSITVVVPGLFLTPANSKGKVGVFVRLMCGCPVTAGPPASLWPASDFTVFATLQYARGVKTNLSLAYDTTQAGNSLFSATLPDTGGSPQQITYTAVQKSTGNYGVVLSKSQVR